MSSFVPSTITTRVAIEAGESMIRHADGNASVHKYFTDSCRRVIADLVMRGDVVGARQVAIECALLRDSRPTLDELNASGAAVAGVAW